MLQLSYIYIYVGLPGSHDCRRRSAYEYSSRTVAYILLYGLAVVAIPHQYTRTHKKCPTSNPASDFQKEQEIGSKVVLGLVTGVTLKSHVKACA